MEESTQGALAALEHYVRVTGTARAGYVEFQYAIGDPSLHLDMILPHAAFAEFCARHKVVRLPAIDDAARAQTENPDVD